MTAVFPGGVDWHDTPATDTPLDRAEIQSNETAIKAYVDTGDAAPVSSGRLPPSVVTSSGQTTNQVPQWNGTAWVPASVAGATAASVGNAANVKIVEAYGADPTGVTDSSAAFMAAIAALPVPGGGEVWAKGAAYKLNSTVFWDDRCVHLKGAGSSAIGQAAGTRLLVAPGVEGIRVQNGYQAGATGAAGGSSIEGFHLINTDSSATGNNGVTLQCNSGRLIDVTSEGFGGRGVAVVTSSGRTAPVGLAVAAVGSGGTFPAGTFYWKVSGIAADGTETVASAEVTAAIAAGGSANLTWTALSGAVGYKVYRASTPDGERFAKQRVATLGNVTSYTDTGTALLAGFCVSHQGQINANNFQLIRVQTYNNKGDGLYIEGGDANVGHTEAYSATANGGWGLWDNGYLGNVYDGAVHFQNNTLGDIRLSNGCTEMYGVYVEDSNAATPALQLDSTAYGCFVKFATLNVRGSDGTTRIVNNSPNPNIIILPHAAGTFIANRWAVGNDQVGALVELNSAGGGSAVFWAGAIAEWFSPSNTNPWIGSTLADGSFRLSGTAGKPLNVPNPLQATKGVGDGTNLRWFGSGAPGARPDGTNAVAGDKYDRTDTPTTANQRIYVCTVGGGTPTWVGIA